MIIFRSEAPTVFIVRSVTQTLFHHTNQSTEYRHRSMLMFDCSARLLRRCYPTHVGPRAGKNAGSVREWLGTTLAHLTTNDTLTGLSGAGICAKPFSATVQR